MTDTNPCPSCGSSATDCGRQVFSVVGGAELLRCCASCSGNHETDTYNRYYPNQKGIA